MDIVFKGSPNFNKRTKPVKKIVIHWFGSGTLESANSRFQKPSSQVSAHYGISKGRVWQWVKESDVAWHSGNSVVNGESIGIEHDALLNGQNLSEQDYQLSGQLIAEIAKRHNIPLSRSTVIGHKEVKPTQCPGTVNIDKIIQIANQHLNPMPTIKMPLTIVANKINWPTLPQQVATLSEWFNHYSGGKLQVSFDIAHTDFDPVPFQQFLSSKCVDIDWQRTNITPRAKGKGTLLLLGYDQYQFVNTWGFMTYGDPGHPVRMECCAAETEMIGTQGSYDYAPVFVHRAFHEICHMIPFLTGQPDWVHEFLLVPDDRRADLLALTDYQKLQTALNNIKPMPKIKIRSIGWNDPEKGLYFPFDTMERRQALLEKLTGLFPDYELDPTEYNLKTRPWK